MHSIVLEWGTTIKILSWCTALISSFRYYFSDWWRLRDLKGISGCAIQMLWKQRVLRISRWTKMHALVSGCVTQFRRRIASITHSGESASGIKQMKRAHGPASNSLYNMKLLPYSVKVSGYVGPAGSKPDGANKQMSRAKIVRRLVIGWPGATTWLEWYRS